MEITKEQSGMLENLLDQTSVSVLLDALSLICFEKAAHVFGAWRDEALSCAWIKTARQLSACADGLVKRGAGRPEQCY